MKRGPFGERLLNELLPCVAGVDLAGINRALNEFCALFEHAAGAERIVSYFGVSHVGVGRETDGGPVRFERAEKLAFHEGIEKRRAGLRERVSVVIGRYSHAVHDDHDDRAFSSRKPAVFLELKHI